MGALLKQMPWFSRQGKFASVLLFFLRTTILLTDHAHRYGDAREPMRKILGPEIGACLKPIWGLNAEGEIRGAWRDVGVPRAWYMVGKYGYFLWEEGNDKFRVQLERSPGILAQCRFYSKHVALREFFLSFHTCAMFHGSC